MPELHWIGKRHVLDLADRVPTRSLRRVPEISMPPGSGNGILHGDNLLALKALLPRYRDRVKLVFIDPPYNADAERWTYSDPIETPEMRGWRGEVGAEGEDPFRHDKWLCMMYPRLTLLRDLLAPDGTIFISIGDNELPRLRLLMDEVFGARNFLGCAVWNKGPAQDDDAGLLTSTHNYIVVYARDRAQASTSEDLTTWWTREDFGDSEEARRELEDLFPEASALFSIPKPVRLIQRIVQAATTPHTRDIVLDCFAGSGTTAHAVLKQNERDGGNRRFILIEMQNFTGGLTAGRVRRAIR
ncbi:MAG TPA: site-specific DNA-methyltransferase, partial [Rubrobacteraceae bacterium]|nr:site-specific DNA-methyltransferase [Rubrobacteraceae bacterium]